MSDLRQQAVTSEELIAKLVRAADTGPEIPHDGAARVKAAVRPVWTRVVDERARRRRILLAIAASIVVAISAVLVATRRVQPKTVAAPAIAGRFDRVRGDVKVTNNGTISIASEAVQLTSGSTVSTGVDSHAAIRIRGESSLRLDAETEIQLLSDTSVLLQAGGVYIDSSVAGLPLEVRTPFGTARDIGTRFEVRQAKASLTIRVRDGAVVLDRKGSSSQIGSGTEVVVSNDGTQRTRTIANDASEWNWTLTAAPPFEIEGRSLDSFLGWVTRETGLEVKYATAEIGRLSTTTILHGEIAELSPLDAARTVLPSTGLTIERSNGFLLVRRLADPRSRAAP